MTDADRDAKFVVLFDGTRSRDAEADLLRPTDDGVPHAASVDRWWKTNAADRADRARRRGAGAVAGVGCADRG